jgi:orotate phosphoribosyltransferase
MTLESTHEHNTLAPRSWASVAARLSAVVGVTSKLTYRYTSLTFVAPTVLTRSVGLNERMIRWSGQHNTEIWLRRDSRNQTLGIRSDSIEIVDALTYWAILDPSKQTVFADGIAVMRKKNGQAVAKISRRDLDSVSENAVCILAPAKLVTDADSRLLSSLAKGFTDAASGHDRDSWSSWLWQQVALGRIKPSYARALGSKILGRQAGRHGLAKSNPYSGDVLAVLSRIGVFERGADYVLPSGLHAAVHVNLGRVCGQPEVLRMLAEQVNERLADVAYDTVVSTGWPVASVARRAIRLRPMTAAGVVRHCEYEGVPPIPLTPVSRGSAVVILTDVRVSGRLIAQVVKSVEAAGGAVSAVLSIVDAAKSDIQTTTNFRTICSYDIQATESQSCSRCNVLERMEFNPVACCMTRKKDTPRSPAEFLSQNPEAAEFWRQVDVARAYEHHRVEGNTHYVAFIDTERLLKHETIGASIVNRLVARVTAAMGVPDVILVPARSRARLFAEKLLRGLAVGDRLWPPDLVSAKQFDGRYHLTSSDSALLRGAKVLIVDTGVTHGATLDDLQDVALRAEAHTVGGVAIICRMSDAQETALADRFEGRFARLYQVPIRPLSVPDSLRRSCPVCRRRDDLVRAAAESKLQPLLELSSAMQARKPRRDRDFVSATAANRAKQIQLMAYDDLPFLTQCRRGTASGITLHSLYAAMNDGMAPLKLPEICDEVIPTTSRTAILEHLDKSAVQWSGEWLIRDALQLLNSRDPDEMWGACAGLLNRASNFVWVDALEHRLLHSRSARNQRSMTVWNRIAFEVFTLLKHEPSYRPELAVRFGTLQRCCANTPAEEGLIRIISVIEESQPSA